METLLAAIQYGAPWALVVMGAIVSVSPPKRENRRGVWVWIIAFGVVGALLTGAQVWSDARNQSAFDALNQRLTGGNHFAYVSVRKATDETGNNLVALTTTGFLPSLRIGFYPVQPDGTRLDQKQEWTPLFQDIQKTTAYPAIAIAPGRYEIHFLMGEKKWIEYLEFERSGEEVDQIFWVERNGEAIYPIDLQQGS